MIQEQLESQANFLPRRQYAIYKSNSLANAFGGLNKREFVLLNYLLSFVKKNDDINTDYETTYNEILTTLGLSTSGTNYKDIAKSLENLKTSSKVVVPVIDKKTGEIGIKSEPFVDFEHYPQSKRIKFMFNKNFESYIFNLQKYFYQIELRNLLDLESKHSMKIQDLWLSKDMNKKRETVIEGDLDFWRLTLFGVAGVERRKRPITANRIKEIIEKAKTELELKRHCTIAVTQKKDGNRVIGFTLLFTRLTIDEINLSNLAKNIPDDLTDEDILREALKLQKERNKKINRLERV